MCLVVINDREGSGNPNVPNQGLKSDDKFDGEEGRIWVSNEESSPTAESPGELGFDSPGGVTVRNA
jgi:hypothetical protein